MTAAFWEYVGIFTVSKYVWQEAFLAADVNRHYCVVAIQKFERSIYDCTSICQLNSLYGSILKISWKNTIVSSITM